jgi:hypothetical protein
MIYKTYIELNTTQEIEEFTNICSQIEEDIVIKGLDEYGAPWQLNAKSLLCSLVMAQKLQTNREHTAHEVDWNTVYVECEKDIYQKISKFAR